MIDDPNQTILQRMFAPAMMPVEQEVTERISMPKSKKPLNTGYGFFPTGGQNMFGVESLDLPDKWVTGLGLLASMAGPEGKKKIAKSAAKGGASILQGLYKKSQKKLYEAEKAGEKIHTLYRGVDDWYRGEMVKDGRFISKGSEIAPHFKQGQNWKGKKRDFIRGEDLFYTINNPEYASKYGKFYTGNFSKVPETKKGRLLEFHVPESYIKNTDAYDLWGDKLLRDLDTDNSPGQYHFHGYDQIAAFLGGLPKEFLQKVYKYGDEVPFRNMYRLPLKGKYPEYKTGVK